MKASIIATIVGAICLVLLSLPANATSTRTWVSGTGSDNLPCSRTQPCLTFGAALSQTTAGGEIDCLDSGGFGIVTINQAVTIKCDQALGGTMAVGTNAITIAAGPNDVVSLEGLDINGTGGGITGISFTSGKALHVSNCVIRGFTAEGINFAPSGTIASLIVQDSKVVDNAAGGILVAPTGVSGGAFATITNTHMDRNKFGLRTQDEGFATVSNSTAASNTNHGFIAAATTTVTGIDLSHSVATHNGLYGVAASGPNAQVSIFEVSIYRNAQGIFAGSGGTVYTSIPATSFNDNGGSPSPGGGFPLQ